MATLEQIKLLESRISRAINFVAKLSGENAVLRKRNNELEETIAALREEKTRVEEGIISALGKLNQFEDAIEQSLSSARTSPKPVQKEPLQHISAKEPVQHTAAKETVIQKQSPAPSAAYTVDEDDKELSELSEPDEIEDSGEAELDIF